MKAICITNRHHDTPERNGRNVILTIGKVYDVKPEQKCQYSLICDTGHRIVVAEYYFKLIDEFRQEQIEKILE